MSDQKPTIPTGPRGEQNFPPPPGPPPSQIPPLQVPQHPNETPIQDYSIPHYDPTHPQFAPPPKVTERDDIYGATPTEEHPPPFPPRPTSSGHHDHDAAKTSWTQKFAGWGTKAAAPFNALANKMGSETFLPTTLDKESEKAARILRSFCKDGIYSDAAPQSTTPAARPVTPTAEFPTTDEPTEASKVKKPRVLLTIPSKVIARAQGLAIFTTARAGFQVSGATGSGILIARKLDGTWSPPSGIQVHSVGAGFVIGLDIYDCVVVINTREALEAFTRTRMSLGSDLAVTAGPYGAGGALDFGMPQGQKSKDNVPADQAYAATLAPPGAGQQQQPQVTTGPNIAPTVPVATPTTGPQGDIAAGSSKVRKPSPFREVIKNPVYSYVKSRGFYAGVQIDGTVVTERKDANAAFYGAPVTVAQIIKGEVPSQGPPGMWPAGARGLFEVLRGAEAWRGAGQPANLSAPAPAMASHGPGVSAAPAQTQTHAAPGVPDVTAGVQGLKLSDPAPGPSSAFGGGPAPPPPIATSAADAKAAEAAAESAAHSAPYSAAPPSYSEPTGTEDLPPAYVADGTYRPPPGGPDSKTGHH